MRAEAYETGLLALAAALTAPSPPRRDADVARVLGQLDGYGQLRAVAEVAPRVVHPHVLAKLRATDREHGSGEAYVKAVLTQDEGRMRSLSPTHRRSEIRNEHALLLAATSFAALEHLTDTALLRKAVNQAAKVAQTAEQLHWEAMMRQLWGEQRDNS